MKVLVLAAHPDDESLGVGGTIARHSADGDEVCVFIVTDGVTAHHDRTAGQEEAARRACTILGVHDLRFGRLRDQRLDEGPLLDVIRIIEDQIADFEPSVVYTHHRGDSNQDHRTIFEATIVATRPKPAGFVRRVLCYEIPSSTEWGAPFAERAFQPSVFWDISTTLTVKLRAFQEYASTHRSEVMTFPHPRSVDGVRAMAQYRGASIGVAAAEAFMLVREIR